MHTRREFVALGCGAVLGCALYPAPARAGGVDDLLRTAPRARFWVSTAQEGAACSACHPAVITGVHHHDRALVKCLLCAQECLIADGERGRCRARVNVGGELRSLVYGRPVSIHVDPIEKKPFYHFLPGSAAYSLATTGCPLRCRFCQNWQLSQARPEDLPAPYRPPVELVADVRSRRAPVVAFTYNEPTVFAEYLLDVAALAREQGLRTVLISCGFMNEAPLDAMCDVLDAIKIDLKGFSDDFYRRVSGARLAPVLRSISQIARRGVHLELVNLVVPTLNDSEPMLRDLARWVVDEVGPDVPVHFTRFHPDYQLLNLPPTPVDTLERARAIALDTGIRYPFVGNVPGHAGNHTWCPSCGEKVIERRGFFVLATNLDQGRCAHCGEAIAGVWA